MREAAREAARIGMARDEIVKAVLEGAADGGCREGQEEIGKGLEDAARDCENDRRE